MGKKKKSEEGGANWMDTYGDLVTLLLTFFVMLYSMSTLDAKKWEIFVRSIGPHNDVVDQVVIQSTEGDYDNLEGSSEISPIEQEEIDEKTLYLALVSALNELGEAAEGVSVSEGDGYTFVVFQDSPFFDGESSVLTKQGKEVLDVFAQVIDGSSDMIGQINIMGHTAQADPNSPNTARRDRMLSSDRAAEVCIYIQEKEVVEPEKLICLSYGQHRPVASNDTSEGRAQNRRVEILLLDKDADIDVMNEFYNDYSKLIYSQKSETSVDEDGFEMAEPKPEDVASGMSPIPTIDEEIPKVSEISGIPEGGVIDITE